MNVWLSVAVAAAVVIGIGWMARRRGGSPVGSDESPDPVAGVPADRKGLYEIGLHPGEDGTPVMYTLTTCRHCVHLRNFLTAHGIAHHLVLVDDFEGAARSAVMARLRSFNPRGSFPTLVLPGGRVVVGFREGEVREAFGLIGND